MLELIRPHPRLTSVSGRGEPQVASVAPAFQVRALRLLIRAPFLVAPEAKVAKVAKGSALRALVAQAGRAVLAYQALLIL